MVLGSVGRGYYKKKGIRIFGQNFCLGCLSACNSFTKKVVVQRFGLMFDVISFTIFIYFLFLYVRAFVISTDTFCCPQIVGFYFYS